MNIVSRCPDISWTGKINAGLPKKFYSFFYSFSPQKWDIKLMMQLRKEGHNFQFMATEDAISSYNFMTAENRVVAAALIPPVSVSKEQNRLLHLQGRRMLQEFVYSGRIITRQSFM